MYQNITVDCFNNEEIRRPEMKKIEREDGNLQREGLKALMQRNGANGVAMMKEKMKNGKH